MLLLFRTLPCLLVHDGFLHDLVVDDVFLVSFFSTTIEQFLNKYRKKFDFWYNRELMFPEDYN